MGAGGIIQQHLAERSFIKPTIGRVVWYKDKAWRASQPLAAIVCFVHNDSCVNLAVFDQNGDSTPVVSVSLTQGTWEECDEGQACWMPFQQGQAKVDYSKLSWIESHEARLRTLEESLRTLVKDLTTKPETPNAPASPTKPA